jgi:hypothetical protein
VNGLLRVPLQHRVNCLLLKCSKRKCKTKQNNSWEEYITPLKKQAAKTIELIKSTVVNDVEHHNTLQKIAKELERNREPLRRDIIHALSLAMRQHTSFLQ